MAKVKRHGSDKPKKHYCPQCNSAANPVLLADHNRIEFRCEKGHSTLKGKTILK